MTQPEPLQVGDIVAVGCRCLGNPSGARAVVVEEYTIAFRKGWTLLFENSANDGFSPEDVAMLAVRRIAHDDTLAAYEYRGATHLFSDWRRGMFASVWQLEAHRR